MKSREEIERILREHKAELREKYGVREIGLFGSHVRGKPRRRSDLDILVEFDVVPGLLKSTYPASWASGWTWCARPLSAKNSGSASSARW